jgi:hypothetical protein
MKLCIGRSTIKVTEEDEKYIGVYNRGRKTEIKRSFERPRSRCKTNFRKKKYDLG